MKYLHCLILPIALLLAACAQNKGFKAASLEGQYQLIELDQQPTPDTVSIRMTVLPERIAGVGPINNWNGPLEDARIGMLIGTRMAGPAPLMAMERSLYQALQGASLQLDGNTLSLLKDGQSVAVFARSSE